MCWMKGIAMSDMIAFTVVYGESINAYLFYTQNIIICLTITVIFLCYNSIPVY